MYNDLSYNFFFGDFMCSSCLPGMTPFKQVFNNFSCSDRLNLIPAVVILILSVIGVIIGAIFANIPIAVICGIIFITSIAVTYQMFSMPPSKVIQSLRDSSDKLQEQNTQLAVELSQLKDIKLNLESEINRLNSSVSELEQLITDQRVVCNDFKKNLENLQNLLSKSVAQITSSSAELSDIVNAFKELSNKLELKEDAFSSMLSSVHSFVQRVTSWFDDAAKNALRDLGEILHKQKLGLQGEVSELRAQKEALAKNISDQQLCLIRQEAIVTEQGAHLASLTKMLNKAATLVENLKNANQEELERVRDEIKTLLQQIKEQTTNK